MSQNRGVQTAVIEWNEAQTKLKVDMSLSTIYICKFRGHTKNKHHTNIQAKSRKGKIFDVFLYIHTDITED